MIIHRTMTWFDLFLSPSCVQVITCGRRGVSNRVQSASIPGLHPQLFGFLRRREGQHGGEDSQTRSVPQHTGRLCICEYNVYHFSNHLHVFLCLRWQPPRGGRREVYTHGGGGKLSEGSSVFSLQETLCGQTGGTLSEHADMVCLLVNDKCSYKEKLPTKTNVFHYKVKVSDRGPYE